MNTRSPEEIAISVNPIPFLRLANGQTVFSQRASRFTTLSKGQDFLAFLAKLATAQQAVLAKVSTLTLPSTEVLQHYQQQGLPPLSIHHWQRQPIWLEIFTEIINQLRTLPLPSEVDLASFVKPSSELLEAQADYVLKGEYSYIDAKLMPLIAAALQVYWVALANALGKTTFVRTATPNLCPVCEMSPVASIVNVGKTTEGLRYLCCPLCASEWHLVRIKCAYCDTTQSISYQELEGSHGAVKAEVCDNCHTYLKIFYLDKDTAMEPVADDLATLILDILVQ
ncbi:MAG: formate dehydrogenase accessory protein FdhE, partial [Beggiatoa sp. IS2]